MNLQQHGSSSQDGSLLPECSSPILPELMIMLPGLHPSHLVSTGIISLKRLRLVCKELNSLSLTAMRYCEVHVGEGWCPPRAQQLVRFVGQVEQRQLRQLRINLTVTSGPAAPTVSQQLSNCCEQVQCLVKGMGPVLCRLTKLTLNVTHEWVKEVESKEAYDSWAEVNFKGYQNWVILTQPMHSVGDPDPTTSLGSLLSATSSASWWQESVPIKTTCPRSLGAVSGRAFSMLALVVSNLQEISLCGCCWDAALSTFGAHCRALDSLHVQIPQVPMHALQNLGQHLPNLTAIRVIGAVVSSRNKRLLAKCVDKCMHQVQHCCGVRKLQLHFERQAEFPCRPESWDLLPLSLQQLDCTCAVEPSQPFYRLLSRIEKLSLRDAPEMTLAAMLRRFPLLQAFTTAGMQPIKFIHEHEDYDTAQSFLRHKILADGFSLDCHGLRFAGGSDQDVRDLFLWLPQYPLVRQVTIRFKGQVKGYCLEQIPHLFPGLKSLTLEYDAAESEASSHDLEMDIGFLAPLAACPSLRFLDVSHPVNLVMSGFVELCKSLPKLTRLTFLDCGVDRFELMAELEMLGRKLSVAMRSRSYL